MTRKTRWAGVVLMCLVGLGVAHVGPAFALQWRLPKGEAKEEPKGEQTAAQPAPAPAPDAHSLPRAAASGFVAHARNASAGGAIRLVDDDIVVADR